MTETVARETQMEAALQAIERLLGGQPATKVTAEVSRGGTVKLVAEVEGGKVARSAFTTGLKR